MRLRPLPALQDNYIWLLDDGASAIAVDPGMAGPLLDELASSHLRLTAVLLTHHHPDHVGGVPEVLREHPDAKIFGPHDARMPEPLRRVGEGDNVAVEFPQVSFDVIEIPGHTTSHIAYVGAGIIFCGDTLFSLGCGRMFEGTPAQFQTSLARIAALPGRTLVCCGHEYTVANGQFAIELDAHNPALVHRIEGARQMRAASLPTLPSCIEDERDANPFLRGESPAIIDALTRRHGVAPRDAVETFSWLRAWKDAFRAPAA